MDRQHILRNVKACLRLAASSNTNEAAAALRQAQAMMRAHGISHAEAMDVDEAEVNTRCRGAMPPVSICYLAQLVADGFGSKFIITGGSNPHVASTVIRFYGCDGNAEVSAYAYTVLRRQLDAARFKYVARIRKRGNREARGEVFARGWVQAIGHLFPEVEVPEAKRLAIDDVFRLRYPDSTTGAGRDLTKHGKTTVDDAAAGFVAGASAKLHRGVGGSSTHLLEQGT
ncbi:MAG: DUF2786 domain-containing protein [Xanthomonadales bacterium]|nr:DUF2786 domain-containing protein [Xanthomonadales bacterium]